MGKSLKLEHRPMTRKDLKEVLKIENASFEQPYSREILEQELKIKAAHVWVATNREKVVGYIDFWIVSGEMELVSIAIHPKYRRRSVADYLMKEMNRYGRTHKVKTVVLDVRASNEKAQKLYKKFGFKKVGLRKDYYSDNREDAIIMKREFR